MFHWVVYDVVCECLELLESNDPQLESTLVSVGHLYRIMLLCYLVFSNVDL